MNIVHNYKERCRRLGISLSELCRLANVPMETIARWEKEEPHTLKEIRRIGLHFNITNPLEVLPFLEHWGQANSLHSLAKEVEVDYRNMKRWTKWKGVPKTLKILAAIEEVINEKESADKLGQ